MAQDEIKQDEPVVVQITGVSHGASNDDPKPKQES